jgi:MFS family permease
MSVFIRLLVSNFLCAFVLGATQFYMLEIVVRQYGNPQRDWLMQIVSAVITFGPVAAYFFSGALAAAYKKAHVMVISSGVAAAALVCGWYAEWWPSPWMYIFAIGSLLGVYSAAKMSCVPLASLQLNKSTAFINAWMSVIFLAGLLSGLPAGTWMYTHINRYAALFLTALLCVSIIFSFTCQFGKEAMTPLTEMLRYMVRKSGFLFKKHGMYLCAGPLFWGVGGATNLAVTAYVLRQGLATKQMAAFIPVWAALGVVIGTLVSPAFNHIRFIVAASAGLLMAVAIFFIPFIAVDYRIVAAVIVCVGIAFGIATNLIDSTYLERVGDAHNEGIGAALQSATLSLFTVIIGSIVGFSLLAGIVKPSTQFPFLTVLCLIPVTLTGILGYRNRYSNKK